MTDDDCGLLNQAGGEDAVDLIAYVRSRRVQEDVAR
jgi:hypothetical protein